MHPHLNLLLLQKSSSMASWKIVMGCIVVMFKVIILYIVYLLIVANTILAKRQCNKLIGAALVNNIGYWFSQCNGVMTQEAIIWHNID